jgi:hypothetical protein
MCASSSQLQFHSVAGFPSARAMNLDDLDHLVEQRRTNASSCRVESRCNALAIRRMARQ